MVEIALENVKLKVKEEKECEVTFLLQIPAELNKSKEKEVTAQFQKFAQLPGFRTGKAPAELVARTFSEKIKNETQDQLLKELIPKILKEKEIHPVALPVVRRTQDGAKESLIFEILVERNPKFKAVNYKKILLEKKIKKISDADVEKELKQLQERNAKLLLSKSEKAEKNHFVVVDYEASLEGKAVPDLKAQNQLIDLSSPQFIEDFGENIVGLAREEKKEIPVQFPQDHPRRDLAGKQVVFQVTLKEIKEKVLPSLDDEFAKDLGLSTLSELKEKLLEILKSSVEKNSQKDLEQQIHSHLLKENPIAVPESMVTMQQEFLVERILSQNPVPPEKLEETKNALRQRVRQDAEKQVKISYLVHKIAEQEKLNATEQDFQAELEKEQKKQPNHSKELEKYFENRKSSIINHLTEEKVIQFILENAKIKEVTES